MQQERNSMQSLPLFVNKLSSPILVTMVREYMDAKLKREEKYQKEIDELRIRDAEDYKKLKIKLETDMQTLEQQLEEVCNLCLKRCIYA